MLNFTARWSLIPGAVSTLLMMFGFEDNIRSRVLFEV